MYESYADVLESYMIAEEGFGDVVKKAASKVIEFLEGLKDKIIAFFKKIVESIKNKKDQNVEALPKSDRRVYATFDEIIKELSRSLGLLSKAIGNFRTAHNSDDESVKENINEFNDCMSRVEKMIDNIGIKGNLSRKNANDLLIHAESVKNAFVQEIDLAIKIANSSTYSEASSTSNDLANKLCSANSKFLSLYSRVLRMINESTLRATLHYIDYK